MRIRVLWLAPSELGSRIRPEIGRVCDVLTAQTIPEVLLYIRSSSCDAVVLSCRNAGPELDDAILEIRRLNRSIPIFVDCARAVLDDAVRLAKLGVVEVCTDETPVATLLDKLRSWVSGTASDGSNSSATCNEPWRASLVGDSDPMRRVVDVIRLVAARRSTVLITGETGTGKEVIARAIHSAGGRGSLPFVAVNCAAIPDNLIEAELFGYARGAFTGAVQSRAGRFEQANGGTLFLDEIGELPPAVQVKLLRVLQEREIQRLGSGETVRLNIRVIAATNIDLAQAVTARTFREDLYYRLNVVPLHLPPLRERMSDIAPLVFHFLEKICDAERVPHKTISPAALDALRRYDWPGNVRQLEHAVEMAVVLSGERAVLHECDFAVLQQRIPARAGSDVPLVHVPDEGLDFDAMVSGIERSILVQALDKCGGNKARAAEMLRMKRTTLLAKIKALDAESGFGARTCLPQIAGQGFLAAAG